MKKSNLFFDLLKYGLTGTKPNLQVEDISNQEIMEIINIAKIHEVLPIVVDAMCKLNVNIPLDLKDKADKYLKSSFLYIVNQTREIENLKTLFNENDIDFIILKGAYIRKFYAEPFFRTSCDVDILIKKKDLKKAKRLLINQLEYIQKYESEYDLNLFSPTKVALELHFSLVDKTCTKKEKSVLKDAWNYAVRVKDSEYEFSKEFFYLYFIFHTLKHFTHTGNGIRNYVDIFVINNNIQVSSVHTKELLEKAGIYTFCYYVEKLSRVWFENETHDETTCLMEQFILESGIYGTIKKRNEIIKSQKYGATRRLLSQIWVSNQTIYRLYPRAKRFKILIPYYQFKRLFKKLFTGGVSKALNDAKAINTADEVNVKEIKKMFEILKI